MMFMVWFKSFLKVNGRISERNKIAKRFLYFPDYSKEKKLGKKNNDIEYPFKGSFSMLDGVGPFFHVYIL